jgi:hypothetical protein
MKFSGQSALSVITEITNSWKNGQGRFFPGAVTIGVLSHYFFSDRLPYKILQLSMVLLAIILFAYFVKYLTDNIYIAALAILILGGCLQFRVQYDPMLQFSIQQPSLMALFFGSLIVFLKGIRRGSYILITISALMYVFVLLTYETTVLFWPIFPLLLLTNKSSKKLFYSALTAIGPLVVVVNLLYLRSKVVTPAAGYTSSFEISSLSQTFYKQFIGAVPLSYSQLHPPGFIVGFPKFINFSSTTWWLVMVIITLSLFILLPRLPIVKRNIRIGLFVMGMIMWVAPSFMVAQTVRWQGELVLGNAYIPVFQQYFGFVLVLLSLLLWCRALDISLGRYFKVGWRLILAGFLLVASSSVLANNGRAVAQYNPGYLWPRETFERSIAAGVFSQVPAGTRLITMQQEYWFNAPFVFWWGGPKLLDIVTPSSGVVYTDCLADASNCLEREKFQASIFAYGRFPNEPRVIIVGNLDKLTGESGKLKGIRMSSPSVYIDYPNSSDSVSDSESRCAGWLKERFNKIGSGVTDVDISIVDPQKNSCLATLSKDVYFNPFHFTAVG